MNYSIKVEQFSGPLDILLQLIEERKFDITKISLAEVTEQYFSRLQELESIAPEDLADFLVIATKLLLIKSQALLPYLHPEEDEGPDLESQLRVYRLFRDAGEQLQNLLKGRRFAYGRERVEYRTQDPWFAPPSQVNTMTLRQSFLEVLERLSPVVNLPKISLERTMTLKERLKTFQERLSNEAQLNFQQLIRESKNRSEVILNFLAILELVKQQVIMIEQEDHLSDITIRKL